MEQKRHLKPYNNIIETIGWTPIVRLNKVVGKAKTPVYAKVEFFNPGGSVKDRIGFKIIEAAEKSGQLKPGGTVVEATSGNTGLGLAIFAAYKGYRAIFTIPDKMSVEKIKILKAFGAEVIVTPTAVPPDSPEYYTNVAEKIAKETPNCLLANQYYNPLNPEAHYETTGPEIWEQMDGKVDFFVCSPGTGGTISGTGKYLKEKNPKIKVVGPDPVGSIFAHYFRTKQKAEGGVYKVEGIGNDKIPGTLHFQYIDEMREVSDRESFAMARRLTREEGIFAGGSSGTTVHAAVQIAHEVNDPDKNIVCILPDIGERYLSKLYSDEWMRENQMLETTKVSVQYLVDTKTPDIPRLVSSHPDSKVAEVLNLMNRNGLSQIPILENGEPVGSVSEGTLMNKALNDTSVLGADVRDVMEPPFPVIDYKADLGQAQHILTAGSSALLVREMGMIVGIITRYDVIHFLTHSA